MKNLRQIDIPKIVFFLALAFFVFLLGGLFGEKGWFPYSNFAEAYRTAKAIVKEQYRTRSPILQERRYDGSGVTRHDPSRAHNGLTLLQGVFPDGVQLRLIDMSGEVLRQWHADYFEIWPDPDHIVPQSNVPANAYFYHTQGMWALPDGSVIFNFAEKGTVKMDKCGAVQWTVDQMTHHSIAPNPDGSFWIPSKREIPEIAEDLLLPDVSHDNLMESRGWYEDTLIRVDGNGQVQEEISLLKALSDGWFEGKLFDAVMIAEDDPTHLNDIEVVTPELASKIDGVEAGDLLVSIRQLHMLAIVDRQTGVVNWHQDGPWVRQHDPDITPEGNILVFNNGVEDLAHDRVAGSNLTLLDPATQKTEIIYPKSEGESFFTDIMGTSQRLPNDNILVTESRAGRVFEIDLQGDIVWEYIMPFDATHASLIEEAIRYDEYYFQVAGWDCP